MTAFHLPRCIDLHGRLVPGASHPHASVHWLCTEQPLHPAKLLIHCTLSLATPAATWHVRDSCDVHDPCQYPDNPFQHCTSTVDPVQIEYATSVSKALANEM